MRDFAYTLADLVRSATKRIAMQATSGSNIPTASPSRRPWLYLWAGMVLLTQRKTAAAIRNPMTFDASQGGNAQTSSTARVIAFYRDGVQSESARAANAAIGATVVRPLSVGDAAMLALPRDSDLDDALEQLRSQPGVVEASPDRGLTLLKR